MAGPAFNAGPLQQENFLEEPMTLGRILTAGVAAAVVVVAGFALQASGDAAVAKDKKPKAAPIDTKGDASARPWKRYDRWP
jgi:hypothetical protein